MSTLSTSEPVQLDLFFDLDAAKIELSSLNQKVLSLSDSKTKQYCTSIITIVGALIGGSCLAGYMNPESNDAIMKGL
jgi:hypothetical protein